MTSHMPVGDLVPELIVLVGAVAILLWALFTPRRWQAVAPGLAIAVLAAAGVAAGALQLGAPPKLTFSGTYSLDRAAVGAKLLILATTALAAALAAPWFRRDPRYGEYFVLLLLSALGAILLAGAADLMELLLGVLLSSAPAYALAAYHRRSRAAGEAAVKYYLLGALTNGLMLYGAALLFGLAGTTKLDGVGAALAGSGNWVIAVACGLLVLGLAFKMGAVPAHAWMPDVAQGAPLPSAAFLTVAAKVGALVALARLFQALPESAVAWRPLAAALAAATMTLGNLAALWQDDVRRLLGWSAVSQTGYALMALVALGRSPLAVPGLLVFLLAYALGTLAAFGVVARLAGLSPRAAYAGLARTRPGLALALAVAFLSFVGIPPLAGFTGKLVLFGAAIEAGYGWLAAVAAVNTVLSIAYYARVLGPMYFAPPPAGEAGTPPRLAGPFAAWASATIALSALALVAAGLGAEWLLAALRGARILP